MGVKTPKISYKNNNNMPNLYIGIDNRHIIMLRAKDPEANFAGFSL